LCIAPGLCCKPSRRPKSLEDLLADYDPDRVKKDFLDQPPAGKEMI
jgi:hypothetical protein